MNLLTVQPRPWWVSGPLIALIVLALLLIDNKKFGLSSPMRTFLTMLGAERVSDYFARDWQAERWKYWFVVGTIIGGLIAWQLIGISTPDALSPAFVATMHDRGLAVDGYLPSVLFDTTQLGWKQIIFLAAGGVLIGFGARLGEGCTSGHAIMGLADLQRPSIVAVVGFFLGGLAVSHLLLPVLLGWLGV